MLIFVFTLHSLLYSLLHSLTCSLTHSGSPVPKPPFAQPPPTYSWTHGWISHCLAAFLSCMTLLHCSCCMHRPMLWWSNTKVECPHLIVHVSEQCLAQAVLWQVVDAKLQNIRKHFSTELDAFWDTRNIYQAQLEAHQVFCMSPNTMKPSCCGDPFHQVRS